MYLIEYILALTIPLQCFLSSRRHYLFGLILPFIAMVLGICFFFFARKYSESYYIAATGDILSPLTAMEIFIGLVKCSIPSVIYLALHLICRLIIRKRSNKSKMW